eukprot:12710701-Ditylum_brightwellii.AAC.1
MTLPATYIEILFERKAAVAVLGYMDMQRKMHLVAGGHLVDLLDNNVYSSMVKRRSMKMLYIIFQSAGLEALYSDIRNTFVNAYTTEK